MKISLILYVYSEVENYLQDLIRSINNQSFKDFDVIIFNDNLENLEQSFITLQFKHTVFEVHGAPNEIRFNSINVIKSIGSEYIIFQDADDFMAANRIEENLKALKNYDLVVNDLCLVNENSEMLEDSWWAERLGNDFVFDEKFLRDKNIVGLGNTSIKKTLLTDSRLRFSSLPLAYDWFLFYQIFKLYNLKALFITTTKIFYRQHKNNTAGFKKINLPRLKHVLNVKRSHYESLSQIGYNFEIEENELNQIKIENINFSPVQNNFHLFWWEETKFLIN